MSYEVVDRGPDGGCPSWLIIKRACGCSQVVPIPCHDPLCVECQKLWAWRVRERWWPVVEQMRSPKLITLTICSGPDLAERWETLSSSFRRFMDTRLGPRNLPVLLDAAKEFMLIHLAENDPDPVSRRERFAATAGYLDRFGLRIQRYHAENDRWPRLRDVIGEGLSSPEVTYGPGGWHPHRHLVVDSWFIPWPLLVVTWLRATKGQGMIVDIRLLQRDKKGMQEAIKYITKAWEIPVDKQDELRQVLFGKKRVWPLGGARPVNPESSCPGCGKPTCQCRATDIGFADTLVMSQDEAIIRLRHSGAVAAVRRLEGRWQMYPLNLIAMPFACQMQEARAGPGPPG